MIILSRDFWIAAGDRAIRTFAQAAVAILTAGGVGILDANLLGAASAGLMAAIISVLTSIATPTSMGGRHAAEPEGDVDLDIDDAEGGETLIGANGFDMPAEPEPEDGLGR